MNNSRDIDFIKGSQKENFKTIINSELGTVEHYFEISRDDEKREYKPLDFLNLILELYYEVADNTKNTKKKLVALANAENKIARKIQEYGLNKLNYDFSSIFSDIDITRKRISAYEIVNEKRNDWLRSIGAICIGSILTWILSYISFNNQVTRTTIVIPKTDTIYKVEHDTVYLDIKQK